MRKILISVLVVLMLILTASYMVNGMNKISVRGVKGIIEKTKSTVGKMARNTKKATLDANNLALVCRYSIDISI